MKRCIVNLAVKGRENYPLGQARLLKALARWDSGSDAMMWTTYPAGCPTHQHIPYAFKYYCMRKAINRGYDMVFWVDSSVVPLKSLDTLWNIIEDRGLLVFNNPGCMEDQFTSEDCLETLGCSIEEARKINQICGGVVGYNVRHVPSMRIFGNMERLALDKNAFAGGTCESSSPRYVAHRHDQSCLSYLVHKYKIYPEPFVALRYTSGVCPDTILELRGIAAP